MADADEDRIPSIGQLSKPTDPNDPDNDSGSDADSDAAPDYRFLPGTTSAKKHALPTRGTKDFEPNSTARQSSTLDNSRKAMTDALSVLRVHSTRKGEMVGVYFANEKDWDGMLYDRKQEEKDGEDTKIRAKKSGGLVEGEGRCVAVEKFTNTYVRTMGKSDRRNWMWLLPEEALFLIERGSLDIRYEAQEGEDEGELDQEQEDSNDYATEPESERDQAQESYDGSEESEQPVASEDIQSVSTSSQLTETQPRRGQSKESQPTILDPSPDDQPQLKPSRIPMSLQGAYAAFIGKSGLTLERYTVYANLKRAGFIVQRAPTWHGPLTEPENATNELTQQPTTPNSLTISSQPISLISRLLSYLFKSPPKPNNIPCHNSVIGPLISPGLFRNYYDVYRQLYLIPQYNYTELTASSPSPTSEIPATINTLPSPTQSQPTDPPLLPTYHLHKPSILATYKKTSPPPPSYTVVVLPSRTTQIPTSTQIGDLLASQPDDLLQNADKKKLETRVKHGRRNVLVAIVDCGIVSYLRFSGGGFEESLWGDAERRGIGGRGGKGSAGRGRGGGRGRGRGGRGGGGGRGRGS